MTTEGGESIIIRESRGFGPESLTLTKEVRVGMSSVMTDIMPIQG